ncbi:MAG TPA: sulfatase, partial [Polyangiaceae bacterium]
LGEDLDGPAGRLAGKLSAGTLLVLLSVLVSLGVPAALAVGRLTARLGVRWLGCLGGAVAIVGNAFVLENGYPGAHLLLALAGTTLFAGALSGSVIPLPRRRPILGWLSHLAACALALFSVFRWPPANVLANMYELDTSVILPWIARVRPPEPAGKVTVPRALLPFYKTRDRRPDVPPSSPALLPENGIVILITIDALRSDVLERPEQRAYCPTLRALADRSVYFDNARSFSAGTRYSLGSMFTGRYASQLPWSRGSRPTLLRYRSPRFNELLSKSGVHTVLLAGHTVLGRPAGIARGFDEVEMFAEPDDNPHPPAAKLIDPAIRHLRQARGPLFLYTHLVDTHLPYDTGGVRANSRVEAYLLAVRSVDRQLNRLLAAIDELGLRERTTLIVTADHGEGFGEHGETAHDKSLHDTQIRVPLIISAPNAPPRRVAQPVSLIDIAPTVLDLFNRATPGEFMGDSLIPFVRGGRVDARRPLYFERSRTIAMLFPDGMKAIYDSGKRRESLFDVKKDPAELHDLRDARGEEADRRIALLRRYRRVHATEPKKGASGNVPAVTEQ